MRANYLIKVKVPIGDLGIENLNPTMLGSTIKVEMECDGKSFPFDLGILNGYDNTHIGINLTSKAIYDSKNVFEPRGWIFEKIPNHPYTSIFLD